MMLDLLKTHLFSLPGFPRGLLGQQLQIKPLLSIHQHRLNFAWMKFQTIPTKILPRYNQAILFVVVQLASFHSLQHTKFAWEAVLETFCLHGLTTEAEILKKHVLIKKIFYQKSLT